MHCCGSLAVAFIELLGRIWGLSLYEFAVQNTVGRAISDALSRIGLILLATWLLWVVLDTAIQEALKPPINPRSARQPSMRVKTILPLLRNAVKIILVVICTITTMANLGINVAPLLHRCWRGPGWSGWRSVSAHSNWYRM